VRRADRVPRRRTAAAHGRYRAGQGGTDRRPPRPGAGHHRRSAFALAGPARQPRRRLAAAATADHAAPLASAAGAAARRAGEVVASGACDRIRQIAELPGTRLLEAGTAAAAGRDLRRGRLSAGAGAASMPCTRTCSRAACFVALHMHAGDGNVHTNIPVNSDNYAMLQTAYRTVERIMALAKSTGRGDFRRAWHRHHQAGVPQRGGNRALPRLQAPDRPRRPLQPRQADGPAAAARRPDQRLHALVRAARRRIADHGAVRHRPHLRVDQELPALRQVQAGVLDPCAARQPALQPAQQDPRRLAADRGLPLRRADPARRVAAAFRRVRRCRRPLHGVPQVRQSLPGGHRLRRCLGGDAQFPAPPGQEEIQPRLGGGDGLPLRHRSGDHQAGARRHDPARLRRAAPGSPRGQVLRPDPGRHRASAGEPGPARDRRRR
jgi:hypothetical protein